MSLFEKIMLGIFAGFLIVIALYLRHSPISWQILMEEYMRAATSQVIDVSNNLLIQCQDLRDRQEKMDTRLLRVERSLGVTIPNPGGDPLENRLKPNGQ